MNVRCTYVRLASIATDLGYEQVDTERRVLVVQVFFDGPDLY